MVTDSTKKALITASRPGSAWGLRSWVVATTAPARTDAHSAAPRPRQIAPGMMKAERQPANAVSEAATSEALPTPMLPNRPFSPSARPWFSAFRTNQAIPTG